MRTKQLLSAGIVIFWLLSCGNPVLAQQNMAGLFVVQWGDPPSETGLPGAARFVLTDDSGNNTVLNISKDVVVSAGGILSLDKQRVTVEVLPALLNFEAQGVTVTKITRASGRASSAFLETGRAAVSGANPWITLPCKFDDISNEPKNQSYFIAQYGDNPGELNHFWKTESYNIINIDGSTSANWVNLPDDRSDYVTVENGCFSTPANLDLLFDHCVAAHDASVDFSSVVGINMAFNDDLDGCAWGGGKFATLDGVSKVWPVTWLPPFGYYNNDVFEHENGHGYGLPHSTNWDNDGNPYDNAWDYMSGGSFSPGGAYGRWGTGGMAYHKEMLQWLTPSEVLVVTGGVHIVDLDPLAAATTSNPRMIKIPLGGNRFWVVEARNKSGTYESGIPDTAVLISEVDTNGRDDPIWVFDENVPAAGYNSNEGSMWKVGETFSDLASSTTIEVLQTIASGGFKVRVTRPDICSPATLVLSNSNVVTAENYSACEITVGPNFNVMGPGGNLTLGAEKTILVGGFKVTSGGLLTIGME